MVVDEKLMRGCVANGRPINSTPNIVQTARYHRAFQCVAPPPKLDVNEIRIIRCHDLHLAISHRICSSDLVRHGFAIHITHYRIVLYSLKKTEL